MGVNVQKNFLKIENKSSLSIGKNITQWEKTPYYNYKKLFLLEKFSFFRWASGFFLGLG